MTLPGEKLQKVLARAGFGSRRQIEKWIEEGRVKVDGKIAQLGDRITGEEAIRLDGRPVSNKRLTQTERRVLIYNKPVGEVVTRSDPEGRPIIFDKLPRPGKGRWIAVGRLDVNTSGLVLLTTDGELAHRLMHPSCEIEREYAVRVLGEVSDATLAQLKQGVALEDGMASFNTIKDAGGSGANHWYNVMLREGRNREVRRLWEAVGVTVSRLMRVRYGPIELPSSVRRGQFEEVTGKQLSQLLKAVDLSDQVEGPKPTLGVRKGRTGGARTRSAGQRTRSSTQRKRPTRR